LSKLKRCAQFTDIHFGRKNNSELHNKDCSRFVDWFIDRAQESNVDHVCFMGDWFEERSSIDSLTAKYALNCAKKLNSLDIPIYFIVGNHDLYYRDNRDVFASYTYSTLENFVIIDQPTVRTDTLVPTLYCPFIFEDEYPGLAAYLDTPIWMGHFEFKGFVLTGETFTKQSGPDPDSFSAPEKIFSGHFHKRQTGKNITYIGNAFPMDFGDANDNARGMAIYDYESKQTEFFDWEDCPKYMSLTLSQVNADPTILQSGARVKIIADEDITHSENSELKQKLTEDYNLREFNIEEQMVVPITDTEISEEDLRTKTTSELVRDMIGNIDSVDIDNDMLLAIWDGL
jgi:DNA repair exonuclease SbcCD nuclease subunit